MKFLRNLFLNREKVQIVVASLNDRPIVEEDEWNRISDNKPTDVVLVACDTYDCGWTIDTAWWYESEKCWMLTGSNSREAQLGYTHWRKLPEPPKTK